MRPDAQFVSGRDTYDSPVLNKKNQELKWQRIACGLTEEYLCMFLTKVRYLVKIFPLLLSIFTKVNAVVTWRCMHVFTNMAQIPQFLRHSV
jgi:hypothetical protein